MIDTVSVGDTLRQSGKAKKQLLIRKRLDESIAQARNYEKHPFLPNTVVQSGTNNNNNTQNNNGTKKHTFKQTANMVRRVSRVIVQKDLTQSGLQTQHSQRSYDSSQVKSKFLYNQKSSFPEDNYISEIDGPQVKMNKHYISFMTLTSKVSFESVVVTNNGNASIYYEWESIDNDRSNNQTLKEIDQKFFCHHEQNVIKPGEEKKFVFSFLSNVTGIFNQEWVLNCSPPTTKPLPRIKLSGHSIIIDKNVEWRHQYNRSLYESYLFKGMQEIVNDVIEQVKTPTPPLPDLENPAVCQVEFEEKNKELNLFYNPLVIKWWRDLEQSLYEELNLDPQEQYWDMNVQYLKDLIEKVYDEDQKIYYEKRFKSYEELSQKKIVERSEIYPSIRQKLEEIIEKVPEISDQIRKENELWDYTFIAPSDDEIDSDQEYLDQQLEKERIQSMEKLDKKSKKDHQQSQQTLDNEEENYDNLTEEEIEYKKQLKAKREQKLIKLRQKLEEKNKQNDELAKLKAEWAKKRKKKLTEEDEKNLLVQCTQTLSQKINETFSEQFNNFEQQEPYLRLEDQLKQEIHDKEYYENILRKLQVSDIDIDGKRILLRVHLKIKDDPESLEKQIFFKEQTIKKKEEEEKKLEEERLLQEKLAKEKKKGRRPPAKKKKKDEEPVQQEIKLDLSFLDQDNLNKIIEQIRFFLDKSCKMVMVMVSFDQKIGKYSLTSSTKFFYEHIKGLVENQVFFADQVLIDNFEEKLETEQFGDNSVVVLENCFFQPEEINFKIGKQLTQAKIEELQQQQQESQANLDTQSKASQNHILSQQQTDQNHTNSNNKVGDNLSIQQQQNILDESQDLEKIYDPEDLEDTLIRVYHEDKQDFITQVNEYGTYLVVEDKYNFFSQLTSLVNLTLDSNVLGNNIGREVINTAYMMHLERDPQIVFMGGLITPEKLQLLYILIQKSFRVVLLGEFGTAAYLNQRNLQSLESLTVDPVKLEALKKVLSLIPEDSSCQIITPTDFTVAIKPKTKDSQKSEQELLLQQEKEKEKDKKGKDKKKPVKSKKEESTLQSQQDLPPEETLPDLNSPEYFQIINDSLKNWVPASMYVEMGEQEGEVVQKELETPLEENHQVIDFGQKTYSVIQDSLDVAKKLLWIGDLSAQKEVDLNLLNKFAGQILYKSQEEKQSRVAVEKQDPLYDFEEDQVCFVLGQDLSQRLCSVELKEQIQPKQRKKSQIGEEDEDLEQSQQDDVSQQEGSQAGKEDDEDEKSTVSGKTKSKYNKADNMNILADFYIEDEVFSSKIVAAPYIHALHNISSHHINTEPDIDEGLSFLDDIKLE